MLYLRRLRTRIFHATFGATGVIYRTGAVHWFDYQQRVHAAGVDLGLDRARQDWLRMRASLTVSVGGTNGKGSTVAFAQAMHAGHGFARGQTSLTYFEFGTLAALDLFARAWVKESAVGRNRRSCWCSSWLHSIACDNGFVILPG